MDQRTDARTEPGQSVKVWDPFVRLFHWSLVAVVGTAAVTGFLGEAEDVPIHVWAGAAMAALILARVVWGFLGGRFARFSRFAPRPSEVIAHLKEIGARGGPRHAGHNPLGALMVFALILVLAGLAATGALVYGGVLKSGPLAFVTTYADGRSAKEIHEFLAWGLLALVAAHLAGVAFESLRSGENLPRAMVTGVKTMRPGDHVPPRTRSWPVLASLAGIALLGGAAAAIGHFASRPGLGVPDAPLPAAYAAECASCHIAYHPSLLPKESWRQLVAGLGDHFGEDASLDPATSEKLLAYLTANSAEAFDTMPANRFRSVDAANPFAITAIPSWKRIHRDIPDAVFASPAVKARGNCAACHSDAAQGLFHPANISIPKEARP